jgi:acetolactate synthase-1/2/3 large subunit
MKASDAVAHLLSHNNVTVGFELIGGMIAHLVDSINEVGKTKLISLHHEQAAAFAAGGVARATNNQQLGLALGTSGPGATNLITGIADCWLDSYPCVFITGQVNTYELKGDRPIRQQGFQELDIVSLVGTITKYSVQVSTVEQLLFEIQKSINIARSGRPGPVLIDVPMNLQREDLEITLEEIEALARSTDFLETNTENYDFSLVDQALQQAEKPLFIVGGGACSEPDFDAWQKKVSAMGIPHVSSLKGSEKTSNYPGYLGMLGAYGTRAANYAVQNADVVIVLGSRLDVRQTGANTADFARSAKQIIQIDIDEAQINNRIESTHGVIAPCNDFFSHYLLADYDVSCCEWRNEVQSIFQEKFVDEYHEYNLTPFQLIQVLSDSFSGKTVHYVPDVGNHQMWVAHSLLLEPEQKIHHSGGLGAMGFSLPTAIGIQATTGEYTVSISGDGGVQLNIQELDILNREKIPVLVLVFNNRSLGMVKNFQDMYFEGRNQPTYWDEFSCSFSKIGQAYGVESELVETESQFREAVMSYVRYPRPLLLEVSLSGVTACKPRLAFGKPIDEQYPNDSD